MSEAAEAPVVEAAERDDVVRLRAALSDAVIGAKEFRGQTFVCVQREALPDVMTFLRDDEGTAYNYFAECLAVDYSQWEHDRDLPNRFEVIYNLMSLKHGRRLFVKVAVDDGQSVPTVKDIFLGAEYPEKEVSDMFGIHIAGNELAPGERFLLPDDWKGYPLRKEYPLGGEDVLFDKGYRGPAVEDVQMPHAGESFDGKTGSEDVSGR